MKDKANSAEVSLKSSKKAGKCKSMSKKVSLIIFIATVSILSTLVIIHSYVIKSSEKNFISILMQADLALIVFLYSVPGFWIMKDPVICFVIGW